MPSLAPAPSTTLLNDVHARLSPTRVAAVVRPRSLPDLCSVVRTAAAGDLARLVAVAKAAKTAAAQAVPDLAGCGALLGRSRSAAVSAADLRDLVTRTEKGWALLCQKEKQWKEACAAVPAKCPTCGATGT